MINMAQLMYTAMLAFAKSAMLSHGANVANLTLYRCAILFAIETAKQLLFPDGFDSKKNDRVTRYQDRRDH